MSFHPRRAVLAATGLFAALLLAGCGTETPSAGAPEDGARALGHVHGLGTDPADGTLYVASHFGVFRVEEDLPPERVADRWQDTMAFTVVGDGHFLASGHPDPREDLPAHLGLIESTDAAQTWQALSLQGEADFHALEATAGRIYGYDSVSGSLLTSTDARTWQTLARAPLVDLAAHPGQAGRVLATTPEATLVEYRAGHRAGRQVTGAPPLVLVDWPTPDLLVGLAPDGAVYVSTEAAGTWQRTGSPAGDPQALDVAPGSWHVATSNGVYRSTDDGRQWALVAGQSG